MDYRLKAGIQKFISKLPKGIGDEIYYKLQRHAGNLKYIDAGDKIKAVQKIQEIAKAAEINIEDTCILEIGTGRSPIIPILLICMGARKVVTVDVNRYLKRDIIIEGIKSIIESYKDAYIDHCKMDIKELEKLKNNIEENKRAIDEIMENFGVFYRAPVEAINIGKMKERFNAIITYNVLEHIPVVELKRVLEESEKTLLDTGIYIHKIDYSDHFEHSDKNISEINFLKYSEEEFSKLAGNRYMYMNRLRDDDFEELFEMHNMQTMYTEKAKSEKVCEMISEKRKREWLDKQFSGKSKEVLKTISAWYGLKK